MRNVLTIAGKELRAYFASPIAYVVIGFFALIYGYFFYVLLAFFNRQSMQMSMGMGGTMNINQMLIAPVLQNVTVVLLFLLPMITMRTYSEEKRTGTMELLLTSPLTDMQIIFGKFLGAMGLYAAMVAVTLIHTEPAVSLRQPGVETGADGLSRHPAHGRVLHLGRPVDLEHDPQPDRGGNHHVRRVPGAVGHQLDRLLRGTDRAGSALAPVVDGSLR